MLYELSLVDIQFVQCCTIYHWLMLDSLHYWIFSLFNVARNIIGGDMFNAGFISFNVGFISFECWIHSIGINQFVQCCAIYDWWRYVSMAYDLSLLTLDSLLNIFILIYIDLEYIHSVHIDLEYIPSVQHIFI